MFQMVSFSVTYLYSFTPIDANEKKCMKLRLNLIKLRTKISVLGSIQSQISLYKIIWQKISHIYKLENCIYFFSYMLMGCDMMPQNKKISALKF